MHPKYRISIIINNYNYGCFVKQAIESALQQTVPVHEVIVVDDGSTDNSLSVINQYKEQVIVVPKANGGQASAFNAGFQASSGDWIWFVDADDWLKEDAVERASLHMRDKIAKIHSSLHAVDEAGKMLGYKVPSNALSDGHVITEIAENGGYSWPPTSGNIFPRWVLDQCMPMPEEEYRLCADLYLCSYAAMPGKVTAVTEPLGFYRIHANNRFHGFRLDSTWLYNQANNILTTAQLTEELFIKYSGDKVFKYPYSRRNIEMLMIADRFSDKKPARRLSVKELHNNWWRSKEIQKAAGKTKYVAVLFWLIIAYAPKPLAKYVILRGIRKGKKVMAEHKTA
ncbi:glycosyltransferase family 2 protein [Longitalea luteola]|uniref:glycosyltransferase family 2 protein n=1 Tax=Longitalea luteola TaxID=2812563 RepID=UPI001F610427|nr:glycosyltransferase family 2 protein [Longitalea luteola]